MTSPQQEFWHWFDAHEDKLFDSETCQEPIFDELMDQLHRVDLNLTFELGPKTTDRREFVVSADGLREAFSAVSSLVAAAPKLDRWHITGFRPRRTPINPVQIGETYIDPKDVEFCLLTKGSEIGIQLFIPGFNEDNVTLKQIGYLMLDEALGEYDVETKIRLIKMLPREHPDTSDRYPLAQLASLFDRLASRLAGPTSVH